MKMITHSSVLIALVLCSAAVRAQSPSSLIKVSELKAKTFNVDGLVFTIKSLDDKDFPSAVGVYRDSTGECSEQPHNISAKPIRSCGQGQHASIFVISAPVCTQGPTC
jgi:hypothetical protein